MTDLTQVQGMIFNVQHYCIHDGPGIRTTVFLKGCPLRCLWCQNPESYLSHPQLFYNGEKCTGCGKCLEVCTHGTIMVEQGKAVHDRALCRGCGACTAVCLQEAAELVGMQKTAGEVFKQILQDKIFYESSGGGATLSGGEPLYQPEFSTAILRLCKEEGIHTAMETSGYARWPVLEQVLPHVDLVLYDLKHMDPLEHQKCTGVSNELILDNLTRIYQQWGKPLIIRIPVIPGYNDTLENMEAAAKFVAGKLAASVPVHLLPYHRLGTAKNEQLGAVGNSFACDPPTEERMEEIKHIFVSHNLTVQTGG